MAHNRDRDRRCGRLRPGARARGRGGHERLFCSRDCLHPLIYFRGRASLEIVSPCRRDQPECIRVVLQLAGLAGVDVAQVDEAEKSVFGVGLVHCDV